MDRPLVSLPEESEGTVPTKGAKHRKSVKILGPTLSHMTIKTANRWSLTRVQILLKTAILFTAPCVSGCYRSSSVGNSTSESVPHTGLWAACTNNLRLIDSAKQMWAREKQKSVNDPKPTWEDLSDYLGRGAGNKTLLKCPCGGTYTIGRLDESARCSLSPEDHKSE